MHDHSRETPDASTARHPFATLLAAIAFGLLAVLLQGCRTMSSAPADVGATLLEASAETGTDELAPISLAEYFLEGETSNADDRASFGGREVGLVGAEHDVLLLIADAAAVHGDFPTQYGAIVLATTIAPPHAQPVAWNRYASLFTTLPASGAAALAEVVEEDVANHESQQSGLSASSSAVVSAARMRAMAELQQARSIYEAAQGWIDDDEAMVESAHIRALAAGSINRLCPEWPVTLGSELLLAAARGDLWESQVQRADRVFQADRDRWLSAIGSARERARTTLELYEQGHAPSRPAPDEVRRRD